MGYAPTDQGQGVLQWTFQVGPSAGMLPWRIVCIDTTTTTGVGLSGQAKIKHPSTTHADGEKAVGVIVAPWSLLSTSTPANLWEAFNLLPQNSMATVRLQGIVPIITDDTVDSTAINAGDFVKSSLSTTSLGTTGVLLAGTASNGALASSANNPAADQHIIGRAFNKVNPAGNTGRYVMTLIAPVEA